MTQRPTRKRDGGAPDPAPWVIVAAAVAAVCFLALIALQVTEWLYYRSAPSVWPGG